MSYTKKFNVSRKEKNTCFHQDVSYCHCILVSCCILSQFIGEKGTKVMEKLYGYFTFLFNDNVPLLVVDVTSFCITSINVNSIKH